MQLTNDGVCDKICFEYEAARGYEVRVDKFFSDCGVLTRRECTAAAAAGRIRVNGRVVTRADTHINERDDTVTLDGETVVYGKYVYLMLNKPEGYVSSTDEAGEKTVLDLLPPRYSARGLFPCGRLDKSTVGLVIMTNDGAAAHRALAPKHHVEKKYRFVCADEVMPADAERISAGIMLADGYQTLPCEVELTDEKSGVIALREGKYHQIRRMFAATGNRVIFLERISFGRITLDPALRRGQHRPLTPEETEAFIRCT